MLPHSVVDQIVHPSPLGFTGFLLYVAVFLTVVLATMLRPSFGCGALVALAPFAFYRELGFTTLTFSKVALVAVVLGLLARRSSVRVMRDGAASTLALCGLAVVGATALRDRKSVV